MDERRGSPRRRAGRPRRPPLTEQDIAQNALAIVDTEGWSRCTMQALAARLGVRAPSLYHHVSGQQGIIDLIRGLIVAEIHDPSIVDLPWEEAIRSFGTAYYRAFSNHPNTIAPLITAPVRDAATLQMYETFLTTLDKAGWDGARSFEVLLGIEHLALGFALEYSANDSLIEAEKCAELGAPLLSQIVANRTEVQAEITEAAFLHLLDDFISAFRHRPQHQ